MKNIRLFHYCLLTCMVVSSPLMGRPVEQSHTQLSRKPHSIATFISMVSELDKDLTSPVHMLNRCITEGSLIDVRESDVLDVLEYASWLLDQKNIDITDAKRDELLNIVDDLVEALTEGDLEVDAAIQKSKLPLWFINKRLKIRGKTRCESDFIVEGAARFHGKTRFYKRAHFKDDVKISGTADIENLVVENCVPSLCVEDLTVTNGSITGTLSINEAVVTTLDLTGGLSFTDLSLDTLSVTDAVITNLTVISCMDDLCIESLSTTDATIGCNLTVGCNISMVDSASAAVGNIVKSGTPFIHNFGTNNTFVGKGSGNFVTSGSGGNSGFGQNALNSLTTGSNNTAVGASALRTNITGSSNVAVGEAALFANKASFNIGVGTLALQANTTGSANTGVGHVVLANNTTGSNNTAVGTGALQSNTTGINNVAIGSAALNKNTIGVTNTAVGASALGNNTIGSSNTVLGNSAGNAVTTGSNNLLLGAGVGTSLTTGDNNIYINSNPGSNESDTIRIGDTQTRAFVAGVRGVVTGIADAIPVLIDSVGQLGTTSSSKRFKHDIQQMTDESSAILDLNPVSFIYNADESNTRQFGLIAEEVDEVFPRLVIKDKNGSPYTVRYEVLPVLLLNEVKKLRDKSENHDDILEMILAKLKELGVRI